MEKDAFPSNSSRKRVRRRCAAKGCTNTNLTKSMYTFPNVVKKSKDGKLLISTTELERCKVWVRNVGNETLLNVCPTKLHDMFFVCADHFDVPAYCSAINRSRLNATAIPSLFICDSIGEEEMKRFDHKTKAGDKLQEGTISQLVQSDEKTGDEIINGDYSVDKGGVSSGDLSQLVQSDEKTADEMINGDDSVDNGDVSSGDFSGGAMHSQKTINKRGCSAKECLTADTHGMPLFTFPRVEKNLKGKTIIDKKCLERCRQWVKLCGNDILLEKNILYLHKTERLCAKHFSQDDFLSVKRLSSDAVPVYFNSPPLSDDKMENYGSRTDVTGGDTADTISNDFERSMKNLDWFTCSSCKERHLKFDPKKCMCSHRKDCFYYSAGNDMDPGILPNELKELTFIEELLIARVHPMISVFKLKGLQYGYSGNVISFPQEVEKVSEELPHKLTDLTSVITVRYKNNSSEHEDYRDFQVRASKVMTALIWLKLNHKYYIDITISSENLSLLPTNGNVFNAIQNVLVMSECQPAKAKPTDESQAFVVSEHVELCHEDKSDQEPGGSEVGYVNETCVPLLKIPNQTEQVNAKVVMDWPTISSEPVDEFKTVGYISCAFPTLFPFGDADLRNPRIKKINPSNYFKHLLHFHDQRFAKHRTFRFFAFNSWMRWTALTDGTLYVSKNKQFQNMSVGNLKDLLKEKPHLIKQMMFHASNLRGTKPYWSSRSNELKSMIEQLGMPTIFLTLSSPDLHLPDLYRLLIEDGTKVEDLSETQRRTLLQDNPLVVDMFFQKRVECFIDKVMLKKYKIIDLWYRIEFQHRGSPHLHGVFWFNDAPMIKSIAECSQEETEEIIKYFDQLISAVNPKPDCPMPDVHPCRIRLESVVDKKTDLAQLLLRVQRHTQCSSNYCLKKNKDTKKLECRFKFPKELQDKTEIAIIETGKVEFLPARNDPLLNKFNSYIIQLWRGNIDIAPVLSKECLIQYLAKYISKSEPKSQTLQQVFDVVLSSFNDTDSVRKALQRMFIKSCVESDYSAQEVCYILSGNRLYSSGGRVFVCVNLSKKDEWIEVHADSNTVGKTSVVEKYSKRPTHLENITLWHAAKHFNLSNWKVRSKPAIVRVFPKLRMKSNDEDNESYFRVNVLLHVPWREETLLVSGGVLWKDVFHTKYVIDLMKSCEMDLDNDMSKNDDVDFDQEEQSNANDLEEWMVASSMGPSKSICEVDLGRREVDTNHDWHNALKNYTQYGSLEDFKIFIELNKQKQTIYVPDVENHHPHVQLSEEQQHIMNIVHIMNLYELSLIKKLVTKVIYFSLQQEYQL